MKTINEERLFKLIPHFFERPSSVLVELAQNASRSGAAKMDITLSDDNILEVSDNGRGTNNPESLLVLADSDWTEEVEANQNPAGWGIFFLLSISESVKFTSNFGSIEVDCNRYLNEKTYRENILQNVTPVSRKGFHIKAKLKQKVADSILSYEDNLSYFNLVITVNGKEIKNKTIQDLYRKYPIVTAYQGNPVYINPHTINFPGSFSKLKSEIEVCWYGIKILEQPRFKNIAPIAIEVRHGSPLTPVLPYRHSIKEDEKLKELWEFIRNETVKYCTAYINNPENDSKKDNYGLIKVMETMSDIATQHELNKLNRFYVRKKNPYYTDDPWGDSTYTKEVVHKGDRIVSEDIVKIYDHAKKEYIDDLDGLLFLSEDTIDYVETNEKFPNWIRIEKKEYTIELEYNPDSTYKGFFNWQKSKISCRGNDIKVLGLIKGCSDGDIFYTGDPDDIDEIDRAIFAYHCFSDEGDTWDTQKEYFDEEINEDIAKIKNVFNISDLLKGMYKANISPYDIRSIEIKKNEMVIKTNRNDKDGNKIRILKVA